MKRAFGINDLAEFERRIAELRAALEPPTEAGEYVAHTDGACFGNPEGPGGWAAVVDSAEAKRWQLWGHLSSTSNNRAEALGVLGALEWIPAGSRLALHSDSELTVRILTGRYKARANADIWELIGRTLADKQLSIQPEWLRGHAGDPLNELADRLSKLGALNRQSLDELYQLDPLLEPVLQVGKPESSESQPPELAGLEARGDWELGFLRSIADQLRRGRKLSEKQQAVVDRIRARGAT